MFQQILSPTGNLARTWLVALVPVVLLLVLLAVYRMSAWLAALIGSMVTFLLAVLVWRMPFGDGARAYLYGSATGIWAVDWITVWGVILFNTLVVGRDWCLREISPLANHSRDSRRTGSGIAFCVGLRSASRRPGRLRLPLGIRRPNPDFAWYP